MVSKVKEVDDEYLHFLCLFKKEVFLMLKIQQVLRNELGENVLNDYFDMIALKNKYIELGRS